MITWSAKTELFLIKTNLLISRTSEKLIVINQARRYLSSRVRDYYLLQGLSHVNICQMFLGKGTDNKMDVLDKSVLSLKIIIVNHVT